MAPAGRRAAPAPPTDRTPTFVGRASELALLGSALDDVAAGAGHAVIVEGEPGIGKSRLLGELVQEERRGRPRGG